MSARPIRGLLHEYSVTAPAFLTNEQLAEIVAFLEERGALPQRSTSKPGNFSVAMKASSYGVQILGGPWEVTVFGKTIGLIPRRKTDVAIL